MENSYDVFDSVADLRKGAMNVLREKAFGGDKVRTVPKEKVKKILEDEINFTKNKMYERLKNKLQSVTYSPLRTRTLK